MDIGERLDKLDWKDQIEEQIVKLVAESESDEEAAKHFDHLGHKISEVKSRLNRLEDEHITGLNI